MSETVKLTVNITEELAKALKELAAREGTTMTNIVNKALALEKYVSEEKAKGSKMIFEDKNGKFKEVVFR